MIGGGNGSSVVLQALQPLAADFQISAVICMTDSGGSSGRLRRDLKVLPPGDVLRAVLALSPYDQELLRTIFYRTRFDNLSALTGHNLGNLFLALGSHSGQDFLVATRALEQSVAAVGHVYPATLELAELVAELDDGQQIVGEGNIDHPEYDRSIKIQKVWLEPAVAAAPEAVRAIKQADGIILAPGSLYGSLIAALLPTGITEAIGKSKARLYYISARGFRADAETGPETLSETVKVLEAYLPRPVDLIVYNSADLTPLQRQKYTAECWGIMDNDLDKLGDRQVSGYDFEADSGGHSAEKLSPIMAALLHF